MKQKKTKKQALDFLKKAIEHKQEWKREIEREFAEKGEPVNVVFL